MPNCIIKGIQDKLWIEYSDYDGELEIDAICIDSDPKRLDIYDYLSESVIEKAYASIREDWEELKAFRAAMANDERRHCGRYYDDQGGWS